MGFLDIFRRRVVSEPPPVPAPRLSSIGLTEPICPHCRESLAKMPGRKTKCPHCGDSIFVRTRPSDQSKILIREDEIPLVEEQWAIKNGNLDELLAHRQRQRDETEECRSRLRARFGCEPSDADVEWALLNDRLLSYSQTWQWGLYGNTRLAMGQILKKANKLDEALSVFLELCYLDLNGPNNCPTSNGKPDRTFLKEFPLFDPSRGMCPPGILSLIEQLRDALKVSESELQKRFLEASTSLQALKLPVSPGKAWKELAEALN